MKWDANCYYFKRTDLFIDAQVLHVREVGNGMHIAHVKVFDFYGDVPADKDVIANKPEILRVSITIREGRLGASLRCEKKDK